MTTLILGRTERDDAAAPGRPELDVRGLPTEMVDWVDCRLCGAPNGADREGCLSCGASLHRDTGTSVEPSRPAPAVWLSTQFLDAGARHALAQLLSCGMG